MRILALGNNQGSLTNFIRPLTKSRECGFTLLELMVVVAIIAIASAGAVLALPDSSESTLNREAHRLAALFDSARAQSRASGLAITWHTTADGFKFDGLPQIKNIKTDQYEDLIHYPNKWLDVSTQMLEDKTIFLGPEPIIPQQSLVLYNRNQSITLTTDGMRPFKLELTASGDTSK